MERLQVMHPTTGVPYVMSSLADDVSCHATSLSLSFHAKPGGAPRPFGNMHIHTPTYAHVLDAYTHKRTCTCTRTAGHLFMSVLKPGFVLNLAPHLFCDVSAADLL